MTKTLTEQWREGTLNGGYYYIKTRSWGCDDKWHIKKELEIDYYDEEVWSFYEDCDIYCVVAPVPNYDKVKEMSQKVGRLEFDNDALDNELKELATKNDTLAMENGRLQEQLKEANAILKSYANRDNWSSIMDGCGYYDNALYVDDCGYSSAESYLEKWGVK